MKKNYSWSFTIIMVCCSFLLNAQWVFNPDQPKVVCNVFGVQKSVKMIDDGNNGLLVFWLDTRSGDTDLYGQHYDADGFELWETDGRLLHHDALNIDNYEIKPETYGFSACWYTIGGSAANPNSLRFQKFDLDANPFFNEPILLAEQNTVTGESIGTFESIHYVHDGLGYHFGIKIQTYGYYRIRIFRMDEDGNLLLPFNGTEIGPINLGNVAMESDQQNGAWIAYTANGAIRVNRLDEYANLEWDTWAYGNGSVGTSSSFQMMGDSLGATFSWVSTNTTTEDIAVSRIDTLGAYAWPGDVVMVCDAEGNQNRFNMIREGDEYFFSWSDGRPGVVGYYAIYGNKINSAGEILWAEDGLELSNQNTYIPFSKMALTSDGHLISAYGGGLMRAQKHDPNGSSLWSPNDLVFCNADHAQAYDSFVVRRSGDAVFCAWVHGIGVSDDGLYIALLDTPMNYVDEYVQACGQYNAYDQVFTETGTYEIEISSDTTMILHLEVSNPNESSMDISACGNYTWNGTDYMQSGTYTQIFTNEAGCDSTVTLQLVISNLTADIELNNNTLSTSLTEVSLSWINCATGGEVAADVNEFTPTTSGSYMVTADDGICNVSSACLDVIIEQVTVQQVSDFLLYPNPTHDVFYITHMPHSAQEWMIHDATGRLLDHGLIGAAKNFAYNSSNLNNGVYSFTLICGSNVLSTVWIKN